MSLDRLSHVIVGGGHFISQSGILLQQCQMSLENIPRALNIIQNFNTPVQTISSVDPGGWGAYRDRQAERSIEAVQDLAQAWGNAQAGNYDQAYQNTVDAAVKAAEAFVDQVQQGFNGWNN
jgi:hypothetical protein